MSSIPDSFINDVRDRVRLSDIIGRHVVLRSKGREFWGPCPFHQEKTPSFSVNNEKHFFHCFGCGAHGDVFRFLMMHRGFSFAEAVEAVAQSLGLTVPRIQGDPAVDKQRQELYKILAAAAAWYQTQLTSPGGRHAMAYVVKRGLLPETVKTFGLGYAPASGLSAALVNQGYSKDVMAQAGLLSERGNDWFRDRLIFPIFDGQGRIIAFGGRTLTAEGQPKYLNSPETPIFNKSTVLYGFYQARQARKTDQVIMVEGYMDVVSLHQAGFTGAVAPLGTALTLEQIQLAWRLASEPILCFDGDAAGQRAAERAISRIMPILKPGYSVMFAHLPAGEDPDSIVQNQGGEALTRHLTTADTLFKAVWRQTIANYRLSTPEQRAAAKQALIAQARSIVEPSVRQAYLDLIYQEWQALNAKITYKGKPVAPHAQQLNLPPNIHVRQEQVLLATLINHPALLVEFVEEMGNISFAKPDYEELRQVLILAAHEEKLLDKSNLKPHLISKGFGDTLGVILSKGTYTHAGFAQEDTPIATARQGWSDVLHRYQHERALTAEAKAAAQEFADALDPRAWQRYKALKSAALELRKNEKELE